MIIDARMRPPYKSYLKTKVPFNMEDSDRLLKRISLEPPSHAKAPSMETFLEDMEKAGITHAVLCGRKSELWGDVPNSEIAEVVDQYPGKFAGLGAVSLRPTTKLKDQVQECRDLGLVGISVDPGVLNPPETCAGSILYPLYALCQEYGMIVYLTSNIHSVPSARWANPAYIDQVAVDFPELTLVVGHASHPFVSEICGVAFWRPNVYLCPGLYLSASALSNIYVEQANRYIGDQLLFGSSYPVASPASVVAGHLSAGFTPEVLEKVMWKNAARLFKFAV